LPGVPDTPRGTLPWADQLADLAFAGHGHYTSMQVRGGRVRGLDLHLARLRQSSLELFGREVDGDRVRRYLRQATARGRADVSAQINVFSLDGDAVTAGRPLDPAVLVRTGPPVSPEPTPVRARTAPYERFLPHVKNVATMGLVYHRRPAALDGFDDVVFVDRSGFISEGSIWNVAFFDGNQIVWPSAPALPGITMQLAQAGLRREGIRFRAAPVHISDLISFRSAVLMNSIDPARPLAGIDDVAFVEDHALLDTLRRCYESNEPQAI
jgi:4-amino-4-deoxychorismate lyase